MILLLFVRWWWLNFCACGFVAFVCFYVCSLFVPPLVFESMKNQSCLMFLYRRIAVYETLHRHLVTVSTEYKEKCEPGTVFPTRLHVRHHENMPIKIDPLKLQFYRVKLWFTGVCIIFSLFLLKNTHCGYSLEPPHRFWVLVRTTLPRRFSRVPKHLCFEQKI